MAFSGNPHLRHGGGSKLLDCSNLTLNGSIHQMKAADTNIHYFCNVVSSTTVKLHATPAVGSMYVFFVVSSSDVLTILASDDTPVTSLSGTGTKYAVWGGSEWVAG